MSRVNIDSQILEQMNRQIDMAYWISGTVIALAIFVVGYQIAINTKTIKSLKKENAEGIKKTAKELFRITLQTVIKLGGFRFIDFKEYLEIYTNEIEYDKDIQNLLEIIKAKAIQESLYSLTHSTSEQVDVVSVADQLIGIKKIQDIKNIIDIEFIELDDNKKFIGKLQVEVSHPLPSH